MLRVVYYLRFTGKSADTTIILIELKKDKNEESNIRCENTLSLIISQQFIISRILRSPILQFVFIELIRFKIKERNVRNVSYSFLHRRCDFISFAR